MHIVYVSDGKAGHRSQALGLYKAMQRQSETGVTFEEASIENLPIFSLIFSLGKSQYAALQHAPDYIFGVGSHTQLRVLLLGKVFSEAKTVILMKPNFPFSWFDHVVIPEHDGVPEKDNVILTQGALNPIVNERRHQEKRILIALGGSSKRHQWNDEKVLAVIEQIIENNFECELVLTTSRRTPKAFLSVLKAKSYGKKLQIFPVEQTPRGWIFEEMQKAEAVWVTEDSVSMIYEALTAGCKVGVIEIDRLKEDRITQSVNKLGELKLISSSSQLNKLVATIAFKEAERVATYLLAP
ncbi:nucleoside-diphosphate sugar epimerase [Acinetobacter sp. LoGeW2-3]|uniref:mitochondrial fission ELM1 family protein n=1 Tax=Acinetobacter sp. LoGeW2-3 TaxID=1808001 RepID=UPI000C059BBA|nr:ELM1/GtrOC1 family putative glycosyltransferase [Acinetobacter sp. LoGeW2-3]ATO18671.1 nucleoside-diphosphate sugar epimerase [Acinetobacter sp. LoGeW2-3]